MSKDSPKYFTFILRCWQEQLDEEGTQVEWRYTLKDPVSGKRLGFSSINALSEFLTSIADSQNH